MTLFHLAPATASPTPPINLDTAKIDDAIGFKGRANGGVYQFGEH